MGGSCGGAAIAAATALEDQPMTVIIIVGLIGLAIAAAQAM